MRNNLFSYVLLEKFDEFRIGSTNNSDVYIHNSSHELHEMARESLLRMKKGDELMNERSLRYSFSDEIRNHETCSRKDVRLLLESKIALRDD